MKPGVAVIGCGLLGSKRADNLAGARLCICADRDPARAASLAAKHPGARSTSDLHEVWTDRDVAIAIIATTNDSLTPVALEAVKSGKHVLVEKPAARNVAELGRLIDTAKDKRVKVRVGFNHRFHPGILNAFEMVRRGSVGELMFVRARYGHGGRVGYDREWRADPAMSGGGELIDQGVHLIDLSRELLGEFEVVEGFAHTFFWKMPVDDNGFMLLRTKDNKVAFLHASCTEWKNLFSLEIYGRLGKLQIDGLGGSYGIERLTHYRMLPEMGPPETTIWEYPRGDKSWTAEFSEFLDDIRLDREPRPGLDDALRALEIVERIYKKSGYDHH